MSVIDSGLVTKNLYHLNYLLWLTFLSPGHNLLLNSFFLCHLTYCGLRALFLSITWIIINLGLKIFLMYKLSFMIRNLYLSFCFYKPFFSYDLNYHFWLDNIFLLLNYNLEFTVRHQLSHFWSDWKPATSHGLPSWQTFLSL